MHTDTAHHIAVRTIRVTASGALIQGPDGRQCWIRRSQLPADNTISRALFDNAAQHRAARRVERPSLVTVEVVRLTERGALVREGAAGREAWIRRCQLPESHQISRALLQRAIRETALRAQQRQRDATVARLNGAA